MKTVASSELAQRVAVELNVSEPQVRHVLDCAMTVLGKELRCGNSVDLERLLTLRLTVGEPVQVTTASGATLDLPGERSIQITLDDELRREIEGGGKLRIGLVVKEKNFFTGVVASKLESPRSEVVVLEGIPATLSWLDGNRPDLVVLEAGMEDAKSACLKIKSKRRTALCSIVEILSEKADKDGRDFEGMKVFADQRLSEPFELSDLVKVVESELSRCAEERNYFEHVATIRLHTEDERIEEANELVGNMLTESGLSEESAAALAVAFREAMDNAARHGNKSDPDRLVTVEYLVDREKVTITVSDEGEGFDTEVYLSRGVSGDPVEAARERNRAGGVGGLGIMLMLKCVDKLEYKYSGNTVTLTKYIRAS